MKKFITISTLLITIFCFGQQKYTVIIPKQFSFQKTENQYRLNSYLKFLFEKSTQYHPLWNDAPMQEITLSACNSFRVNIKNNSNMFVTKLIIELYNCKGEIIFTSKEGKSREKDFNNAYKEAITLAFESVNDFSKNLSNEQNTLTSNDDIKDSDKNLYTKSMNLQILYAKLSDIQKGEITLTNSQNQAIFKLQKTSAENIFLAQRNDGKTGVFSKKDNIYIFEYMEEGNPKKIQYHINFQL